MESQEQPKPQELPQNAPPAQPKKISKTVEDKDLIKSILFMKTKGLIKDLPTKVVFETVKEAEDSKKEDILAAINEKLNNVKEDISRLQKDGASLKLYSLKLLQIPMKIKIWKSNNEAKELENIFKVLDNIQVKLKPLIVALDKKEAEKE